jgi:hypothetical protein
MKRKFNTKQPKPEPERVLLKCKSGSDEGGEVSGVQEEGTRGEGETMSERNYTQADELADGLILVDSKERLILVDDHLLTPYEAFRLNRRIERALFEVGGKIDSEFEVVGSMEERK